MVGSLLSNRFSTDEVTDPLPQPMYMGWRSTWPATATSNTPKHVHLWPVQRSTWTTDAEAGDLPFEPDLQSSYPRPGLPAYKQLHGEDKPKTSTGRLDKVRVLRLSHCLPCLSFVLCLSVPWLFEKHMPIALLVLPLIAGLLLTLHRRIQPVLFVRGTQRDLENAIQVEPRKFWQWWSTQ